MSAAAVLVSGAWISLALSLDALAQSALPRRSAGGVEAGPLLERSLAEFWRADGPSAREKAAAGILRLGADFDTLLARLEAGRVYSGDVHKGLVEKSRKGREGLRHEYAFLVPSDYDPSKQYPVCFYLHGGVDRTEPWKKGDPWWKKFDRFDGMQQIAVFPSSWRGALWWQSSQIENLQAILDRLKADYNVDENRVYLFGVSDGGTGVYYHALKAPTPWAAFFPFLGYLAVLDNPATGVDGRVFLENLVNKPFFVVNGEMDPLYPVDRIKPMMEELQQSGVELVFRPEPGGHNTRWWNGAQEAIQAFMDSHPRNPLPDRIVWETERTDRFSRLDWLVVDELDSGGEAPSGRVELSRRGSSVQVTATGVRRYKLLLSPKQFDLTQPIEVVTNGVSSFRGRVERSAETLLHWAARDFDRTMLFAAELEVDVAKTESSTR